MACTVLNFLTKILFLEKAKQKWNERSWDRKVQLLNFLKIYFSHSTALMGVALDIWDELSCGAASVDELQHSLAPQVGGSTSLNSGEKFLTE